MSAAALAEPVDVYDGQLRRGSIVERGRAAFEAIDAEGRSLGTFGSMPEARLAILAVGRATTTRPSP